MFKGRVSLDVVIAPVILMPTCKFKFLVIVVNQKYLGTFSIILGLILAVNSGLSQTIHVNGVRLFMEGEIPTVTISFMPSLLKAEPLCPATHVSPEMEP